MSRREAGKSERRTRIIMAARELMRESGDTGLSMRALAERAGVSLATPYNLFGSKRAVVEAVLDDIRGFHERFARLDSADRIERIIQAAMIQTSYYVAEPGFYTTLWSAVLGTAGGEARRALWTPQRYAFWHGLVQEAIVAGDIDPAFDVDLLCRSLDFAFRSVMLHWVLAVITLDEMQPSIGYGFALALRGAATPAAAPRIGAMVVRYQAEIARHARPLAAEPVA